MCGRYALALRPSQVRQMLQDDDVPVHDAPADEGDGAPRQSYNFAPGYHGVVYRADVPDWGAGPRREAKKLSQREGGTTANDEAGAEHAVKTVPEKETEVAAAAAAAAAADADADISVGAGHEASGAEETRYKLQSMKWGLVPFWTKRNPDYGAVMKTINCRDDSLGQAGGMWASMKGRKRCVVLAQGFYEWLKSGREKVPHFVRRADGRLMCFAGLWDCVKYEDDDEKHYTYTIITTSSNKQLRFLHDRMPVILDPASAEMRAWLDPSRHEWSRDLQDILRPFDGELEVYPVSREVGKVGNNSPSFIIPVASRENKSNIANFFANAQAKGKAKEPTKRGHGAADLELEKEGAAAASSPAKETKATDGVADAADDGGMGVSARAGEKRKGNSELEGEGPPMKKEAVPSSPAKPARSPAKPAVKASRTISATSNGTKSPAEGKGDGTQKITKFFGNSA